MYWGTVNYLNEWDRVNVRYLFLFIHILTHALSSSSLLRTTNDVSFCCFCVRPGYVHVECPCPGHWLHGAHCYFLPDECRWRWRSQSIGLRAIQSGLASLPVLQYARFCCSGCRGIQWLASGRLWQLALSVLRPERGHDELLEVLRSHTVPVHIAL